MCIESLIQKKREHETQHDRSEDDQQLNLFISECQGDCALYVHIQLHKINHIY